MASELFHVPLPLWYSQTLYKGHHREPVTVKPIAMYLEEELSVYVHMYMV